MCKHVFRSFVVFQATDDTDAAATEDAPTESSAGATADTAESPPLPIESAHDDDENEKTQVLASRQLILL